MINIYPKFTLLYKPLTYGLRLNKLIKATKNYIHKVYCNKRVPKFCVSFLQTTEKSCLLERLNECMRITLGRLKSTPKVP